MHGKVIIDCEQLQRSQGVTYLSICLTQFFEEEIKFTSFTSKILSRKGGILNFNSAHSEEKRELESKAVVPNLGYA